MKVIKFSTNCADTIHHVYRALEPSSACSSASCVCPEE